MESDLVEHQTYETHAKTQCSNHWANSLCFQLLRECDLLALFRHHAVS